MTSGTGSSPGRSLAVGPVVAERLQLLRQPVYLVGERRSVTGALLRRRRRSRRLTQSRAVHVAARRRVRRYGRARRRRRQHRHFLQNNPFSQLINFLHIT